MRLHIFALLLFAISASCHDRDAPNFEAAQQRYPRVRTAIKEKDTRLRKQFEAQGLTYPPQKIFIRAFKQDKIVEVWAFSESDAVFKLATTYAICATSGNLGPKRREGDLQIPEGFYHIERFNPKSNFYLSLGLNYPNASDRILGDTKHPGSDIFIHGGCVTIGCIPITDDAIKALYWLAVQAKSNGQSRIPVHIFPTRLDKLDSVIRTSPDDDRHRTFWKNLQIGYNWFEKHRTLPEISVNRQGGYEFKRSGHKR